MEDMVVDYLKRAAVICRRECLTDLDFAHTIDIVQHTLIRIRRAPDKCSVGTLRKIKLFVDAYEKKNKGLYGINNE